LELTVITFLLQSSLNADGGMQGCQMVYFQTKIPDLGKILRALEWKMLSYFMTIWNILLPFGIINGRLAIWCIFPVLVCLDQEKSGNPGGMPPDSDSVRIKLCHAIPSSPILLQGQIL
jgi:hypothetical protein